MIELIDKILDDNAHLLNHYDQMALLQRLEERGNSQEALDAELEVLKGAYNWNRAIELSLMLFAEQCTKALEENNIAVPNHPDYIRAWGRVSETQQETMYPALMHAFRVAKGLIAAAGEREQTHKDTVTLFKDLVSTLKFSLDEMGVSLKRTRFDKDQLRAIHEPVAPAMPEPNECRDQNEEHIPKAKLREARAMLGKEVCPDDDVREVTIYRIWHVPNPKTLCDNVILPLRKDSRLNFTKLSVRKQCQLCELLLHRKAGDGFSASNLQNVFPSN